MDQTTEIEQLRRDLAQVKATAEATKFAEKASRKALKLFARRLNTVGDLVGGLYAEKAGVTYGTAQERAWAGQHGFLYVLAHLEENWRKTRVPFWKMILDETPDIRSACEFGCNIGANLKAIKEVRPSLKLAGVEISPVACEVLRKEALGEIRNASIIDVDLEQKFDLVFCRGVLIHLNPDEVAKTLANMAKHAIRYVLIYEIFSDANHQMEGYSEGVTGGEAGHGYQFWRDFSGDFAKQSPDWHAVRSGVNLVENAEPKHGDLTWTLFRARTVTI